jgi:hypothetical protein
MQHALKTPPRIAGAQIVSAEFFDELYLAAFDKAATAPDARLRGITLPSLRHRLERKAGCRDLRCACQPPVFSDAAPYHARRRLDNDLYSPYLRPSIDGGDL